MCKVRGGCLIILCCAAVEQSEFFGDGCRELAFLRAIACEGPCEEFESGDDRWIEIRAGFFGDDGKCFF